MHQENIFPRQYSDALENWFDLLSIIIIITIEMPWKIDLIYFLLLLLLMKCFGKKVWLTFYYYYYYYYNVIMIWKSWEWQPNVWLAQLDKLQSRSQEVLGSIPIGRIFCWIYFAFPCTGLCWQRCQLCII